MRTLRRASSLSATALLVAAAGLLAALLVGTATGRWRTVPVLSGSMAPSIGAGDLVLAQPVDSTDVRPGDVLVFHPPGGGRLMVHRVASVDRGGQLGVRPVVVTKGDANDAADPWRARIESEKAWRVTKVVPGLGRAVVWAEAPAVHLGVLVAVAGALAALALRAIWRTPTEYDKSNQVGVVERAQPA